MSDNVVLFIFMFCTVCLLDFNTDELTGLTPGGFSGVILTFLVCFVSMLVAGLGAGSVWVTVEINRIAL